MHFWSAFWMDFGGPDPRKWSSRVHETLVLIKSHFPSQGRFLIKNGAQKAPKMEPKGHAKSMKKVMHFLIGKMIDFWSKVEPKGRPKGAQRDAKIKEFGSLLARPGQDPPKDAKWSQNDSKMKPKWNKNGVTLEPTFNEK